MLVVFPRIVGRRRWIYYGSGVLLLAVLAGLLWPISLPPANVTFSQSTEKLQAYDFVEIAAQVSLPHAPNPFVDAAIRGTFEMAGGQTWQVEGFCDSADGS